MVANEQSLRLGWSMDDPSIGIPNSRWCLALPSIFHLHSPLTSRRFKLSYSKTFFLTFFSSLYPPTHTPSFSTHLLKTWPHSLFCFFSFSLLCSLLNTSLPPPHFHPILWNDYSFPGYQWLTAKSPQCPVHRTLPSWRSFLWMSSYSSRTRSVWIQCSPKHIFCPFLVHASSPWTPSSYHWEDNVF